MSRPKKTKVGRKSLLTPETTSKIVSYVRAGAYDWVAAQAAGISTATFYRWMEGKTPEHAEFRDAVLEARAQARMAAEIQVRKEKPEVWLMRGPGRERPGEPGWGERVEVAGAVQHNHKVRVDLSRVPDEDLEKLEEILARTEADPDAG